MGEKGFFELIFGSFFRWWWMLITGAASLLSYVFFPDTITISHTLVALLTLLGFTLIFLCLSTVYQGWALYKKRLTASKVIGFQRSDKYEGSDYVFLIESPSKIKTGTLAELKRLNNGVEVSFALVEYMEYNSKDHIQAKIIWFSPGHQRDLRLHKFLVSDIIVDPLISLETIYSAKDNITGGLR